MYESFHVKNFRCFKDLQINDLGRVNLIAGKNNTGKTALLEAMYLHTRPLTPQVLFHLNHVRGLEAPDANLSTYWKHYFYNMDSTNSIEIAASNIDDVILPKLTIAELSDDGDKYDTFATYHRRLIDHGMDPTKAVKVIESIDAILEFAFDFGETKREAAYLPSNVDLPVFPNKEGQQRSQVIPVQGRPDRRTVTAQISQLEISGELPNLIETLKVFEPQLNDLRLLSPHDETMIWGRVNGRQIPLRLMGEGINRACHFIVTMRSNPESCLFIDEIENGIHHSVQKNVWKAIGQVARELDIQIFATTHSLEMIRAAYEAFSEDKKLDEFRYHRLDRDRDTGDIEAVTYNKRGLEAVAAFDFDFEVRG